MNNGPIKTKRLLRHPATILLLSFLVVCGILKWRAHKTYYGPPPPYPPLPSPNARDFIDAAFPLMKDKYAVDWSTGRGLPIPPGTPASVIADPTSGYHTFTDTERDRYVQENLPAIREYEKGLPYKYGFNLTRSLNEFHSFSNERELSRVLMLASRQSSLHRNWSASVNYSIDAMYLGTRLMEDHPSWITSLTGHAIDQDARHIPRNVIDNLSAAEAEIAAKRLERLDGERSQPWQAIEGEEEFTQGCILDLIGRRNGRQVLIELADPDFSSSHSFFGIVRNMNKWVILRTLESPQGAYDHYTEYMDGEVTFAKLPWPKQLKRPQPPLTDDLISSVFVVVSGPKDSGKTSFTGMLLSSEAVDRIDEVELALQAYKATTGSYPAALSQLVPAYISHVPLDPFSDGQPMRYSLTGRDYLLYSIGADGVDDGGKPMYNPVWKSRPYAIHLSDKGDIVADINY